MKVEILNSISRFAVCFIIGITIGMASNNWVAKTGHLVLLAVSWLIAIIPQIIKYIHKTDQK